MLVRELEGRFGGTAGRRKRLAIVSTHPIQYYAPWFRYIAAQPAIELKVFYLWNPALTTLDDPGFGHTVEWDIPLCEGYSHEFVPNVARLPGSSSFSGIDNPDLPARLNAFRPDAALLIGYRYKSMIRLIAMPRWLRRFPLCFRGDSHRLAIEESKIGKVEVRRWVVSKIYSRFEAFLYVGHANRDYFRIHGVPDKKLFFSPHAVDNERFCPVAEWQLAARTWRAELGISEETLIVMFAGKFEAKKRPLDLLRAFSKLSQTNVALLFVGSGALETVLRKAASAMKNIFFAPFQNQSLMPRTYATADLFVLPSYGNEETWGLAINEAMSAGKPVVVSDHVGCARNLVVPGVNGMIFEAGNVDGLAAALREALSDKARLIRWGHAGQKIISNYDFAHATEGLQSALAAVTEPSAS